MAIYPYRYPSDLQMEKKSMLYSTIEVNPKVALEFRNKNVYFWFYMKHVFWGRATFAHLRICTLLNRESDRKSNWSKQYVQFLSNYFLTKAFLSFLQGFVVLTFMTFQILILMAYPRKFCCCCCCFLVFSLPRHFSLAVCCT